MNIERYNYVCKHCKATYATYQSRWSHIKNKHNVSYNDCTPERTPSTHKCSKCKKCFTSRQHKWRHNKICKQDIQQVTNNQIINNNQNIIINDYRKSVNIYINGVGYENLKDIPYNDVKKILSNGGGGQSILDYIKSVYFNKTLPENHSFCTTNIKSSFLSVLNNNTKLPELCQKKYYFDELIKKVNDRITELYEKYIADDFVVDNKDNIKDMMDSNKNFVDKFYGDKLLNGLIKEIEVLTYNNRKIVKDTWNGKNNNYLLIRKFNNLIKQIESTKIFNMNKINKNKLIIEYIIEKLENHFIK